MSLKFSAIILAAGSGTRMGTDVPKQRIKLSGKSVLERAVLAFEACDAVDEIIVVTREADIESVKDELSMISKLSAVISGGKTRAESAKLGFEKVKNGAKYVAIHDAARCFVTEKMINSVFFDAVKYGAATASSRVSDSVKKIDGRGFITESIDRDFTVTVQTPQIFSSELYRKALLNTDPLDPSITDDNSMLLRIGVPVYCTETGSLNIKLTKREDLEYAEFLLGRDRDV